MLIVSKSFSQTGSGGVLYKWQTQRSEIVSGVHLQEI